MIAALSFGAQAQFVVIGAGAITTNGNGADPVCDYYTNIRYQAVYLASELSTGGMTAGASITALGFSVSEDNGPAFPTYSVGMAHTAATNSAAHNAAALTTVKNSHSFDAVVQPAGTFQMITFDIPFIWDGVSNVLVDLCSGATSMVYLAPYGGVRADVLASGARMIRDDGLGSRCNSNTDETLGNRPQIRFNYSAAAPCSGTPAPGNTTASVSSTCSGTGFTVGLQNPVSGTDITFQWEMDNGGGWTPFGTNASTQAVSQTVSTSYRCTVTCPTAIPASTTSTPITVTMAPPFPVDFTPVLFPPNCWTQSGPIGLARDAANGYGVAGTGSARWNFYNVSSGTLTITSPTITALGAGQQIRFDVAGTYYDDGVDVFTDQIVLESSTNGGGAWNAVSTMSNALGGALQTAPGTGGSFVPTGAQWATRTFPLPAGTNMVRFRGVSGFGNNVYVDNITVEAIPVCDTPSGVSGTGTSATSADIAWTGTGTFIVEYGPASTFTTPGIDATGGPEGTSTVVTGVTSPYSIASGLVHPTQYRVFVRKDCTGTGEGYSANSVGVSFYTTPPNDQCAGAGVHSISPGGTISITGNSHGATDTEGFGALNAWEQLTVTACMQTLEINYCATAPPWTLAFNNLFTSCPPSGFIPPTTNLNNCPNGNRRLVYNNVAPGVYYIAITNLVNGQGAYDITVIGGAACPPPPPNDLCADAVPLTCGDIVTGTAVNATTTGAPTALCSGFLNNTSGGVWYSTTGVCGSVTASICSSTSSWDSKIAVYSGTCGAASLVCVATDDDGCGTFAGLSTISWTAEAEATYYIYVLPYDGATAAGAFTLELTCPNTQVQGSATVTDDCANDQFDIAVAVTDLGGAASVTVTYTVDEGTPISIPGVTLAGTTIEDIAAGSVVDISIGNGSAGCALDLGERFSNCPVTVVCGTTLEVEHCYTNVDTRTFTYFPSIPGETLTLTFIAGTMDANDVIRGFTGEFLDEPIIGLTGSFADLSGVTGTSIAGSGLYLEIESDPSGSCADGDQVRWLFEVECTPGCIDPQGVVSENSSCATYSFTLDVEVLTTGDGAMTDLEYTVDGGPVQSVPGLTDGAIEQIGPFTIGSDVEVVLTHATDGSCDRNLGTFDGDMGCPPPGVSCALPFVVNGFPFSQTTTTCGRGNDHVGTQCGLAANYGGGEDVVYELHIPAAGEYQINLAFPGATFAGWFLKASGSCSTAASCLANAVSNNTNAANGFYTFASAGTYYLIVDSRPLPNCVNYTLTIAPFIAPPGENCGNAINIPSVPTTVSGTTNGYTDNYNQVCPYTQTGGRDIVYSYTPPVDQYLNLTMCLGTTNYDTKLYAYANTCTGTSIGCNDDLCNNGVLFEDDFVSSISNLAVTGGTTYYFVVDGYSAVDFGDFTLEISFGNPPPPNDLCTGAIDQPLSIGGTNTYAGTTVGATDTEGFAATTAWESFTTTTCTNVTVNYCVPGFEFENFFINLTNTCPDVATGIIAGAVTTPNCAVTFLNVPPGTWYIPVLGEGAGQLPGPYEIEVSAVSCDPPPANDLCANAETLSVNAPGACPGAAVTGSTNSAGDDAGQPGCDIAGIFSDVWYSFNSGTGTTVDVDFAMVTMAGFVSISLFDACGGTELDCTLSSAASVTDTWAVALGTNYFVRIASNTDAGDVPGSFTICLSQPPPPPANDLCANAEALTVHVEGECPASGVTGTTIGATEDLPLPVCDDDSEPGDVHDVWYSFNSGAGSTVDYTIDWGTMDGATSLALYDACGGTELACEFFFSDGITGEWTVDPNTDYHVRVWSNLTFGDTPGTFNICLSQPAQCSQDLTLEFTIGSNGNIPDWELRAVGSNTVVQSGTGFIGLPTGTVFPVSTCLPDGSYYLVVSGAMGTGGGYVLRTSGSHVNRLVDNTANYVTGATSQVATADGLDIPLGANSLIYTSCDKYYWKTGEYIVCNEDVDVSGQFGITMTTSGYEFWIYNPNGGYSFRKLRTHQDGDGFAPFNAVRACHMKINNWAIANQVPQNVLMNVRVRARVAGVNKAWGPACRFIRNDALANCPPTKLMDIPGNPFISCGATKAFVNNTANRVHARPISGATQYQFRFSLPAEGGVIVTRQSAFYYINLGWAPSQSPILLNGVTYDVDVRAMVGGVWCAWGDICKLTICNTPPCGGGAQGGNQNMSMEGGSVLLWPNPNRGDQVLLSLDGLDTDTETITVDVFDMTGKRIIARTLPAQHGAVTSTIELNGDMAAGVYMVNITAGDREYVERLVIQP